MKYTCALMNMSIEMIEYIVIKQFPRQIGT